MRQTMITMLLIVFGMVAVSAQDEDTFRLREPGLNDFLKTMIAINIDVQLGRTYENMYDLQSLIFGMQEEFSERFSREELLDVPYDLLNQLKPRLRIDSSLETFTSRGWHDLLFHAWLRQTQPDLSSKDEWEYARHSLQLQPVDLNGDGVSEWIVHLQAFQGRDTLVVDGYFVIQADDDSPEGYQRIDGMNFWTSRQCDIMYDCDVEGWLDEIYDTAGSYLMRPIFAASSVKRQILQIDDITGDGLPEIIATDGTCGNGICVVRLSVWTLEDQEIVQLADLKLRTFSGGGGVPLYPRDGEWSFRNIDEDPALEIIETRELYDNRGCQSTTERVYQLVDDINEYQEDERVFSIVYADSPWCDLRFAHIAMNALDFETTIQHYEHFLAFEPEPANGSRDLRSYAKIRLATAYALVGRLADASELLGSVNAGEIADPMVRAMAEAGQAAFLTSDMNAIELCASLHYAVNNFDKWTVSDLMWRYGQLNDLNVTRSYPGGDFDGSASGCSIRGLWNRMIPTIDPAQPLREQLENAGWDINVEYSFDLDGDHVDEHLIWVEENDFDGLFRWFDGKEYHVNNGYYGDPFDTIAFETIPLSESRYANVDLAVYPDIDVCPYHVRVWVMGENDLDKVFNDRYCEPQSLEQTFPAPGELHILSPAYESDSIIYQWSDETNSFFNIAESIEDESMTNTDDSGNNAQSDSDPEYLQYNYRADSFEFCGDLQNPEETLKSVNAILQLPVDSRFVKTLRYCHALVLDLLSRSDEALAEYIAIYEDDPESPWGMLAELHLERIES